MKVLRFCTVVMSQEHAAFEWNSFNTFTSRNMSIAPKAEPICVTIPHQSKAFLPHSRSVVAMHTLENVMKADNSTDAII